MASAASRSYRFGKLTLRRKSPAVVGRGKSASYVERAPPELPRIRPPRQWPPGDEKAPHEAGPVGK